MSTPGRSEARGRTRLPPLTPEAASAVLAPPRLSAGAADSVPLACRAAAAAVPVLLAVPAAAGRLLVARALHALGGRPGPLVAVAGRRPSFADLPAGATLYLDAGALAVEAALGLEALLDDGQVWVLAGVEPGAALPAPLARRLGTVVLAVPPLGARTADLPALADAFLARLAERRGCAAPELAPEARARLEGHRWTGDVAELEAVLARAVLTAPGRVLEPEHLTLEPVVEAAPAPAAAAEAKAERGEELEFLLAELAHELRNPMVTIKTYAEHLPALLEDAELRTRFATLSGEAIERIEGLLDNVLTFARFGRPRRETVELDPLLARVLGELEPELAGRALHVRHASSGARCAADAEQLAYALRNLFAGVVREVPAREELVLDAAMNGVVTLRFATGDAAGERLRRLVGGSNGSGSTLGDPTLLPLAFRLARAVLERNGGGLAVVPLGSEATALVVRLPAAVADGG